MRARLAVGLSWLPALVNGNPDRGKGGVGTPGHRGHAVDLALRIVPRKTCADCPPARVHHPSVVTPSRRDMPGPLSGGFLPSVPVEVDFVGCFQRQWMSTAGWTSGCARVTPTAPSRPTPPRSQPQPARLRARIPARLHRAMRVDTEGSGTGRHSPGMGCHGRPRPTQGASCRSGRMVRA